MLNKKFDPKNNYNDYLELIRRIYQKRLNETLTQERVQSIAEALMRFGGVCHNFYSKKKGKKPVFTI